MRRVGIIDSLHDHTEDMPAMAIWDKLKTELDRAGRTAQGAIDEGRLRLESFRARQLADRAAQTLGYALYNARRSGGDLEADAYARLSAVIAGHEADAVRFEEQITEIGRKRKDAPTTATV